MVYDTLLQSGLASSGNVTGKSIKSGELATVDLIAWW